MDPISLYLVSGYLGSGKTTFLRHILEQISAEKVGVLVNEFGSIGIDGKVLPHGDLELVEINNGSIFCSCLKADFVKALLAFLRQPVDRLYIEASGIADPTSIQTLLTQVTTLANKHMQIERTYDYKGSACIVDAVNFLDYLEVLTPIKKQVMKSNFIVLNKTDLVSPENLAAVRSRITALNPAAYRYETQYAAVPLELLQDKLTVGGETEDTVNKPWNRPVTYILDMPGIYGPEQLISFCRSLQDKAFRIKGILMTGAGMTHIDVVGSQVVFESMSPERNLAEAEKKLVLIGRDGCDFAAEIEKSWQANFTEPIKFME